MTDKEKAKERAWQKVCDLYAARDSGGELIIKAHLQDVFNIGFAASEDLLRIAITALESISGTISADYAIRRANEALAELGVRGYEARDEQVREAEKVCRGLMMRADLTDEESLAIETLRVAAVSNAKRIARQQLQAERVKIAQDLLWVRAGATNFVQLSEDLGKFADRLRGEGE